MQRAIAFCCAVMDMIESVMVRHGISNGLPMRLVYRTIYVVIIAFIAVRFLHVHAALVLVLNQATLAMQAIYIPGIHWFVSFARCMSVLHC